MKTKSSFLNLCFGQSAERDQGIWFESLGEKKLLTFVPIDTISYVCETRNGVSLALRREVDGRGDYKIPNATYVQIKSLLPEDLYLEVTADAWDVFERKANKMNTYIVMKEAIAGCHKHSASGRLFSLATENEGYASRQSTRTLWSLNNITQATADVTAFVEENFKKGMPAEDGLDWYPAVGRVSDPHRFVFQTFEMTR